MDRLYYISQGDSLKDHLNNVRNVCEAGCKLVQLRLKNVTQDQYNETASEAKKICESYNSTLIINDNIEAGVHSGADGIHLGKKDRSPTEARKLTSNKIIGGTANTLEDCLNLIEQQVDYIGLGPFKDTTTKKVLSPILGMEGYELILSELKKRNCPTPIYAIGGVELEDIDALINLGFYGVAISSALTKATSEQSEDAKNSTENLRLLNSLTSNILNS